MILSEYDPPRGVQRCLTALLLVALLALPVCGGALANSSTVKVTVDLTGHASFEQAWTRTYPYYNATAVTELVIVGESDRSPELNPNDWRNADKDYLTNTFTGLKTLDMSGHTGGYSNEAFMDCTFQEVRLRENISLPSFIFLDCKHLTTLAVGNRAFTPGVIDLRGCNVSSLNNASAPFNHSGITHVRLPADTFFSFSYNNHGFFQNCEKLTTLALGDKPFVDGVVDLTGYSFTAYGSSLFQNCKGITRVRLPANVIPGMKMFSGCQSLTTLALGDRPFVDGVVDLTGYSFTTYNTELFVNCVGITNVRLPADVPLSDAMFGRNSNPNPPLILTFLGGNAPTHAKDPFYQMLPSGTLYYPQNAIGYGKDEFYTNLQNLTRVSFGPLVITEPSDQVVVPGQDADFTVTVTDGDTPSYQWQILTSGVWTDVADGGVYAGAKTNQLSLTQIPQNLNGAQYRCVLANARQLLLTRTVSLTVPAPTLPPPKTGDGAKPVLWAALGALALAGGLWLALTAKPRRSRLDP